MYTKRRKFLCKNDQNQNQILGRQVWQHFETKYEVCRELCAWQINLLSYDSSRALIWPSYGTLEHHLLLTRLGKCFADTFSYNAVKASFCAVSSFTSALISSNLDGIKPRKTKGFLKPITVALPFLFLFGDANQWTSHHPHGDCKSKHLRRCWNVEIRTLKMTRALQLKLVKQAETHFRHQTVWKVE